MKDYILAKIAENSYMFTENDIKFINNNISLITKIFRLGSIDRFNMTGRF